MSAGSRWGARRRRAEGCEVLRGRLLPVKDGERLAEEGDSDDSDGGDSHFMDASQIEGGGGTVYSTSLRKSTLLIEDDNKRSYRVSGYFPFVDPWWYVEVKVKRNESHYFAQGYPSYTLQNDMFQTRSILSLFLNTCHVHDLIKQEFMNWLPSDVTVTFENLGQFTKVFHEKCGMELSFEKADAACIVINALSFPTALKYLPQLLPRHIKGFFTSDPNSEEPKSPDPIVILKGIEAILESEPWKLGFQAILYRELKLCHCEATWSCFLECKDILENIPKLQTNALIIYDELKKRCRELGDTYVEQEILTELVCGVMPHESAWEALKFLKDHCIVVLEGPRVFIQNLYQYEEDIAKYIDKVSQRKTWSLKLDPGDILNCGESSKSREMEESAEKHDDIFLGDDGLLSEDINIMQISNETETTDDENILKNLDPEQLKAAKMVCSNPVTVISGKGGCGKTTVVSLVLKYLVKKENKEIEEACKALEDDLEASEEWNSDQTTSNEGNPKPIHILFTAPTGKAASLLRKKTGLGAATLHQITCSYSAWKKQKTENPWKFSKVQALVVDEGSLASVHIFSSALKLLYRHSCLAKLIILGDIRQLPSIEPGNLLADLFISLNKMKWVIELKTNHRAESQLIVDNATRISLQKSLKFDAVINVGNGKTAEMPGEDKKFIFVALSDGDSDLVTAINLLLDKGPGLKDHKHSQFIAFRRGDCMLINELCCKHYSHHTLKNHKKRYVFQCGDKVCCTKNVYVKDLLSKNLENSTENQNILNNDAVQSTIQNNCEKELGIKEKEDRLCNGEIFFITLDVEKYNIRELTLCDTEEREYNLNYKLLKSRSGLRHAWARTIHTFQKEEVSPLGCSRLQKLAISSPCQKQLFKP
ncbi:hypothetical protein GDO86_005717 [Hymenochirus boettgeri]|uniref:DNA helicase B n=1 Tax=Hymenochirus boettgeri TaxID=247094 RepID=A0A8T2J7A8_9PIPI|nr:hypothetical protein GDO86_005717 [Hymenochirus boettgeri]